jgi:hypothetical protein
MRPCRPPRPVPVTTTAFGHLFQVSRQNLIGRCQRPIVDNRTRPVIPRAYWNVTGRCLHRVRSFNHRVRSSRKKRISPFLTVRLDLVFLFIHHRFSRRLAVSPSPRHHRARRPRQSSAIARHARTELLRRRARAHATAATAPPHQAAAPALSHRARACNLAGATLPQSRLDEP